jgi:hypothetical protein
VGRRVLDEAHFIKNANARTSHCLKLLGVQNEAKAPLLGPELVFLLTGTPMANRPRDLFNLLRCVAPSGSLREPPRIKPGQALPRYAAAARGRMPPGGAQLSVLRRGPAEGRARWLGAWDDRRIAAGRPR